MPFSSGVFSLASGNPVTTATTISSTWANNTLSDIATGLSTCVLKDGTQTITANIPMSSFKFTGLAAGSAAGDSLRYEQVFTTGALTLLGPISVSATSTFGAANFGNQLNTVRAATLTATATVAIGAATGNYAVVTGTATVSGFDAAAAGALRIIEWSGATPVDANTTNRLPTSATITATAGDTSMHVSEGTTSGWRALFWQRANGNPLSVSDFSATQANQETATSTTLFVSPGTQQFHPSAPKGWVQFTPSGTVKSSYNVSSVSVNSTADWSIIWTNPMSSSTYCVQATPWTQAGSYLLGVVTCNASSVEIFGVEAGAGTALNPTNGVMVVAFGDLP